MKVSKQQFGELPLGIFCQILTQDTFPRTLFGPF